MGEQKIIEKQLLKNMLLNFIAFTIIFTIFGTAIFNTLKIYLYSSSDDELYLAKNHLQFIKDVSNTSKPNVAPIKKENNNDIINPRIISILRDSYGNILNKESIGRFYDEYIPYIDFNKNNLDEIYNVKVNGYYYRSINFKITDEDESIKYAQLLINVDAESSIISDYLSILALRNIYNNYFIYNCKLFII